MRRRAILLIIFLLIALKGLTQFTFGISGANGIDADIVSEPSIEETEQAAATLVQKIRE